MNLAKLKLHITNHAYQQHSNRVEEVEYGELREWCNDHIGRRDYYQKGDFVNIAGIWWAFVIEAGKLNFVTCYGKCDFDLPQAIAWAKRLNDRINLDGGFIG